MMQMIEAGGIPPFTDGERIADDNNPKGYYELEAVKQLKSKQDLLDHASGQVVKVIHMLVESLPPQHQYRIVFMRREISEVLRSQRKMLERDGKKAAAIPEAQLAKIFDQQLKKSLQWISEQDNIEVLEVNHHQAVTEPQEVAETVNQFLGAGLKVEDMVGIVDPSLYRERLTGN